MQPRYASNMKKENEKERKKERKKRKTETPMQSLQTPLPFVESHHNCWAEVLGVQIRISGEGGSNRRSKSCHHIKKENTQPLGFSSLIQPPSEAYSLESHRKCSRLPRCTCMHESRCHKVLAR